MALIVCPDCKNQISSFASQCPFCGRPANVLDPPSFVASSEPIVEVVVDDAPPMYDVATEIPQNHVFNQTNVANETAPKDWLVESVLVMGVVVFFGFFIFFGWLVLPFGIAAIYNATQVNSRWYAGFKMMAIDYARKAKLWTIVTALLFGLTILFKGLFLALLFSKF